MSDLGSKYPNLAAAVGELREIKSGEWECRCPAHEDHKPSLWIKDHGDKVVLACRAGCETADVLTAFGIRWGDLFVSDSKPSRRIVAKYDYTDENGTFLYQALRFEPKDFRQRRKARRGEESRDGWVWNLNGVRRVLYQLPRVISAKCVIVVEGEKDADNVNALSLTKCVATCSPMGVGNWIKEFSDTLAGKRVVILPDNDEPGIKHAQNVRDSLRGVAAHVKIIDVPDVDKKGDISDWLSRFETPEEKRDQFIALIRGQRQAPQNTTPIDVMSLAAVAMSGCGESKAAGHALANILKAKGLL